MFARKLSILKFFSVSLAILLVADTVPHPQLAPGVVASFLNFVEQPSRREN